MRSKLNRFFHYMRKVVAMTLQVVTVLILFLVLTSVPLYLVDKGMAYIADPIKKEMAAMQAQHDHIQEQWESSKERFLALPELSFEEERELEVIEKQIVEQEQEMEQEVATLQAQLDQCDRYTMLAKAALGFIVLIAVLIGIN